MRHKYGVFEVWMKDTLKAMLHLRHQLDGGGSKLQDLKMLIDNSISISTE